jgi:hypothetical protein
MSRQSTESLAPAIPSGEALRRARDQLWRDGWTLLPDVVPAPVVDALNGEANRLLAEVRPGVERQSATDEDGGVLVMNSLDAHSELLFDFARTDAFLRLAEVMLGKAPMPVHSEYFGKPGAGAEPTPPHQDQVFYESHFNDEPAITFWIPLQDVLLGEGAMEYGSPCPAPGKLLPHRKSAAVEFGAQLVDAAGYTFTPVPVPRGGCIVHHSYAVHRSGPMTGSRPRRVLAFNYRGSSYREYLRRSPERP